MVLATKRAVGSEYGYSIQQNTVVREQKVKVRAKKRPSPMAGIVIISLLFVIGISYTFLQAAKAHLTWQVSQSKQAIASMQMDNEKIKLQVAKLKSLDRIEMLATSKLQMVKNPGIEYLAYQASTANNVEIPVLSTNTDKQGSALAGDVQKSNLIQTIVTAIGKGTLDKG